MNNSTTPRRWALAVMTLLCLLVAQYAQAQCNVFKSGPLSNAPIPITLYLAIDPPNPSSVELTEADMPGLAGLSINTGCAYELSQDSNFTTTQSLPKVFTCDDAGTVPQIWYVRVAGTNGPSARFYRLDILVIDDYAPLVQCPADLTLSTDPAACTRIVVEDIKVYTEDAECNAEEASWEITNDGQPIADGLGDDATGVELPQGVNIITYTVTDKSAKVASCAFTITVEDTEGPTLTCPGDLTLHADTDCQATLQIESPILDACNLSSWNATLSDGQSEFDLDEGASHSFVIGETVDITLSGADELGNAATPCTYTATLLDTITPKITCPLSLTVNANASCEYEVADASLDATLNADNCGDLVVSVNADGDVSYQGRVFP
ncbi:MAG TPA: hypothetical protein PKD78_05475, partial [Saprospiraceae bacterium]|nr:hypothetical protein [Saprospiraceae bacterium]